MFQTEIIIFLQSFASDSLTSFFKFFTEIGRSSYVVPIIGVIMFGISFRIGYILVHLVFWNGTLTSFLKELFSLPRPANVDVAVRLLGKSYSNSTHFTNMGGNGFFGRLPSQVIEYLRVNRIDSWGFPSGHASQAVSLWGFIFLIYKKTWVRILSVVCIIFIPLSRMYLGRHFLADILGGLVLGAITVMAFYKFVFKNEKLKTYLFEKLGKIHVDLKTVFFLAYSLAVPFLLLLVPGMDPKNSAVFLGLNIGFLLLWIRGIPKDSGGIVHRIARVFLAGIFYFGISLALEKGTVLFFGHEPAALSFFRVALSVFLLVWGSTEISIKLGFFKRSI